MEVFVEPAQARSLGQPARAISSQADAVPASWFNGFSRSQAGNYVGSFFLAKKMSDIVIGVRIIIFQSERTNRTGCPWTWSIQVMEGPRRMVMEKPSYSNRYFRGPHEAAIDVRDDLRAGGYSPTTQPTRSSVIAALVKEHGIAERVAVAEDRASIRRPKRKRVIDT